MTRSLRARPRASCVQLVTHPRGLRPAAPARTTCLRMRYMPLSSSRRRSGRTAATAAAWRPPCRRATRAARARSGRVDGRCAPLSHSLWRDLQDGGGLSLAAAHSEAQLGVPCTAHRAPRCCEEDAAEERRKSGAPVCPQQVQRCLETLSRALSRRAQRAVATDRGLHAHAARRGTLAPLQLTDDTVHLCKHDTCACDPARHLHRNVLTTAGL